MASLGPVLPGPPANGILSAGPHNYTILAAQYVDNGGDPLVSVTGSVDGVPTTVNIPLSQIKGMAPPAVQQTLARELLAQARNLAALASTAQTPVEISLGAFTL